MFAALRRLLRRWCGAPPPPDGRDDEPAVAVQVVEKPKPQPCAPPAIFVEKYHKVLLEDVTIKEALCLTSDVAVLANAHVSGGDSCITGNVFVAGDVHITGNTCVTGTVIVLGSAVGSGDVTVTQDVFVGKDLQWRGRLHVGGKIAVFGSQDVQPQAA